MNRFEQKIFDASRQTILSLYGLDLTESDYAVEKPRDRNLGDYALSVPMKLAKTLRKNPFEIAEAIAAPLSDLVPEAEQISVARPGFINFKIRQSALSEVINDVLDAGDNYGHNNSGNGF